MNASVYRIMKLSFWISLAVIVAGILIYAWNFRFLTISEHPEHWGQLGDYLNMYVSFANLIVVFALTYAIHRHDTMIQDQNRTDDLRREQDRTLEEARRDREGREEQVRRETENEQKRIAEEKIKIRPILIFRVNLADKKWYITNVSSNVAINIRISYSSSQQIDNWSIPVKAYSLGPGAEQQLFWFSQANKWRAVYLDSRGNTITSTCYQDETTVEIDINGLSNYADNQYKRLDEFY